VEDRKCRSGLAHSKSAPKFTPRKPTLLRNSLPSPGRNVNVRLFFSSPGAVPFFWSPWPDQNHPLPYTARRPIYPLFGSNTSDYGEVAFDDHEDGEYLLVLHMNELIEKDFKADATRTADTSGHHNTARLDGARFPQEQEQKDHNIGVAGGQAIHFPVRGGLRVASSSSLEQPRTALSLELWVKPLVDLNQDGGNRFQFLAFRAGAWTLILEEDRRIQATVVAAGKGDRRSGSLGPALPIGRWSHVGFSYDGRSGRLTTHIDGKQVGDRSFGAGDINRSSSELEFGPLVGMSTCTGPTLML